VLVIEMFQGIVECVVYRRLDNMYCNMKAIGDVSGIECLLWPEAGTRVDIIAYSVQNFARYSDNPGPLHWEAVLHIMT